MSHQKLLLVGSRLYVSSCLLALICIHALCYVIWNQLNWLDRSSVILPLNHVHHFEQDLQEDVLLLTKQKINEYVFASCLLSYVAIAECHLHAVARTDFNNPLLVCKDKWFSTTAFATFSPVPAVKMGINQLGIKWWGGCNAFKWVKGRFDLNSQKKK